LCLVHADGSPFFLGWCLDLLIEPSAISRFPGLRLLAATFLPALAGSSHAVLAASSPGLLVAAVTGALLAAAVLGAAPAGCSFEGITVALLAAVAGFFEGTMVLARPHSYHIVQSDCHTPIHHYGR
jgi:hypothetical protein